jgi:anti-anti-sigma factor
MTTAKPCGTVEVTHRDDVWRLALHGEHDVSTTQRLDEAMQAPRAGGTTVVVDLTHTTFIDSSVINWLARCQARTCQPGNTLRLAVVGPPPGTHVGRFVELVHLGQIVPVYPTPQAALAALGTATDGQAAVMALYEADERLDRAWRAGRGIEEALSDAKELSWRVGRDPAIEDAKLILARRYACDTATAFDLLKAASQRSNRKLREIARDIMATGADTEAPSG